MSNDFKQMYETKCLEFDELNDQFNEYQSTWCGLPYFSPERWVYQLTRKVKSGTQKKKWLPSQIASIAESMIQEYLGKEEAVSEYCRERNRNDQEGTGGF